jgi:cell division protein ZapA
MTAKKHTLRVTILNEEYAIRSETPPEHARAVADYLDKAIKKVLSSGAVVDSNRAVVLAALQITGELFEARESLESATESMQGLSDYIRPLLPPAKRQNGGAPT